MWLVPDSLSDGWLTDAFGVPPAALPSNSDVWTLDGISVARTRNRAYREITSHGNVMGAIPKGCARSVELPIGQLALCNEIITNWPVF